MKVNVPQNKTKQIINSLKRRRKELGISQLYLGNKIGLSQNAYGKIEKGTTRLDIERLFKICTILEINPEEIIRTDEE